MSRLSPDEIKEITALLEKGKRLPDKYRHVLFNEAHQGTLIVEANSPAALDIASPQTSDQANKPQSPPPIEAKRLAATVATEMPTNVSAKLPGQSNSRDEKIRPTREQVEQLLNKYADLVKIFLEIAERKVSVLDEYGDERTHLLAKEADVCLAKIAAREGLSPKRHRILSLWAHPRLRQLFAEYHQQQKGKPKANEDLGSLSGVEFETHIARTLLQRGWQVSATPTTGDQGADLIANKDGRIVVIQVKRYNGSVGNNAVQEVVGAIKFYNGNEGCVVTNSTFTAGARALAQKNNVRLIDGSHLEELSSL